MAKLSAHTPVSTLVLQPASGETGRPALDLFVPAARMFAVKYVPDLPYPDGERAKLDAMEALFRAWHQHFAGNGSDAERRHADEMVFDGFYPYYFSQPERLLFVGRESRQIAGFNYIDLLSGAYRERKQISSRSLDADRFHSRILRIAYGILHGMPAWQDIPPASTIGDTVGSPAGLSFAFMNISKLSNETEG